MLKGYPVVEIFDSIQGEGRFIGCPATFIRLGGCNLHCAWCDTDFTDFEMMEVPEILELIHHPFVVITGGEPGIHDLTELLKGIQGLALPIDTDGLNVDPYALQKHSFVAVETNGTFAMKKRYKDLISWVTCSPKPESNYAIHEDCIPDELKYVVDDKFHVCRIPLKYMNPRAKEWSVPIWLQPQGFDMEKSVEKAYQIVMIDDKVGRLRLGVQLHKIFNLK